ncbi:MAG: hypothetical protein M3542_13055 [Acidobacteriota bacterium]|nr:hypothetical protein [Acidobacteriota bacterium]MDQ5871135.1 hypothetical protein [Acidobacteriota bacterium]
MTFVQSVLSVLAGLLLVTAVGYALIRFFADGLSRAEKIAWSFATGLFAQSLLFVICISIAPGCGPVPVFVLDALIVGGSLLVRRPRRATPPRVRFQALTALLLFVAGAAWLVFLVEALGEPMWSTDYLAMWGLKGKTVFELGFVPTRLFQDPALYWAHREYPLLVPISLATLASFAGGWDDQALGLLFPLCELATLLALFGFLARRVSSAAGAAAAALASLDFFLYRAVNAGTAEVPLALALVLVSCAFLDVLDRTTRPAIARLLVASLLCVSMKQEGTLFVLLLAAVMWPKRRRAVWALVVPPVVHWALLYVLRGPQTRRDFDLTLFGPRRWMELPPLFAKVIGRILGTEALLAWAPLLAIALFLVVTRRGIADRLLPVFPLQIFCYAVAFSVSSFDPMYAVDGAFRRIALTLFPAFTLVLGARLSPSRGAPTNRASPSEFR